MGRPFLVEFDDINADKFYVCRVCSTPFARNTDVFSYWMQPGNVLEEFNSVSFLVKVSNVVDSGIVHEVRNVLWQFDWQEIHCISCNNQVGIKFIDCTLPTPCELYVIGSDKILFRINGENHDPETVSPEDWFESWPPGVNTQ